ncbi:MAG: ion channel [Myxococcota bacterium]
MSDPTSPPPFPYRQGQLVYTVEDAPWRPLSDLYFHLMRSPLWQLIALSFVAYLFTIGLFAGLYRLGGDCIEHAAPGSWADAFWFSVHTFSTIGYGTMSPGTPWANVVATMESWLGLVGVAGVTALLFSRFARPVARVRFAEAPVVCLRNGRPTLQVRVANERSSGLVDVRFEMYAMVREVTPEGQTMARLRRLELVRNDVPYFGMSFTAMHPITEDSPLYRFLDGPQDDLRAIRVHMAGVELSMSQAVWALEMYPATAVRFGHRYVDAVDIVNGVPTSRLAKLSKTEPEP